MPRAPRRTRDSANASVKISRSVSRSQVGGFGDFFPLIDFGLQVVFHLGISQRRWSGGDLLQELLAFGCLHAFYGRLVQELLDGLGRSCGGGQRYPRGGFVAVHTLFRDGGNIRQDVKALRPGYGQRAQPAFLQELNDGARDRKSTRLNSS